MRITEGSGVNLIKIDFCIKSIRPILSLVNIISFIWFKEKM
ncbi:hypothetical protein CSCA_5105 [Clostridium scatologenes]|uniref:Uncharacterized protein n=1 Tax=Clostridium scatologenes TaxID=1548 RepID=A0A0E3K5A8_CLOSL|nr:hypothetical protein CSCA_5105 [Clostridium scatologenes]